MSNKTAHWISVIALLICIAAIYLSTFSIASFIAGFLFFVFVLFRMAIYANSFDEDDNKKSNR